MIINVMENVVPDYLAIPECEDCRRELEYLAFSEVDQVGVLRCGHLHRLFGEKPSIKCCNCDREWSLAQSTTNRCPGCAWIVEIYYAGPQSVRVVEIYNKQLGSMYSPLKQKAQVAPLINMDGFAVFFPDQERLAEVAKDLINV